MIVRELSEFRDENGDITLENRIRATIEFGFGWYADVQAQDFITERLRKIFDNQHTLLKNVPLVGTPLYAPMILLSPQGVRLIFPSRARGIFRARGEEWQKFDSRMRRFRATRPNLQFQALSMARGIHRYLQAQGFPLPDLEAVMIFTNPQTHVDSASPAARIVLADAIDHFASKALDLQPVMDQEDIGMVVQALIEPKLPEPEAEPELEAAALPVSETPQVEGEMFSSEPLMPRETRREFRTMRRLRGLTVRQWAILAILAFFDLLVLGAIWLIVVGDLFSP